jgi:VanZ family protein
MGLIYALSAQTSLPELPDRGLWLEVMNLVIKKGAHLLAFGVLAWLYLRVLRLRYGRLAALRVVSIAMAAAYGLTDEYHQTFVPAREGRLFDVGVDTAGACSAMVLDWWLARRRLRREQVRPVP